MLGRGFILLFLTFRCGSYIILYQGSDDYEKTVNLNNGDAIYSELEQLQSAG